MVGKDKGFQFLCHVILAIMALLVLFPLALLILSSMSSESDIIKYGYSLIPRHFDFSAYKFIFSEGSVFHAYMITILVTLFGTLASVLVTTMLAYTLTIHDLPGRRILGFLVLFTMLFSG